MANTEHVFPNSKFKWTEELVKDLLAALISSKTTTGFFKAKILMQANLRNMKRY